MPHCLKILSPWPFNLLSLNDHFLGELHSWNKILLFLLPHKAIVALTYCLLSLLLFSATYGRVSQL